MKADFSRFRFNLNKGYTRVLQQQGRVTLDADWNEHVSIQADLDQKRLQDVIGRCGAPYGDAGFLVSIDGAGSEYDLNFEAGTFYIAGRRIFLDAAASYSGQPFLQPPPAIGRPESGSRVDLVYLCVRERHVTYLEDETIREIALGGPDTTTRVQTVWQVHVKEDVSLAGCEADAGDIMEAEVGAGLLTTIEDAAPSVDEDLCITPADSGYRGLENRLYRVEVHKGGTISGGASVKWSRYNGAVAFNVLEINVSNRILTLARLGWDQIVTLSPNSWIELVSEEDELAGRPGAILQISADAGAVNDAQRQITLKDGADITNILNDYAAASSSVKVRLWGSDAIALDEDFNAATNKTEITLEDGIKIEIGVENSSDGFRTGDYWTFTARTITGRVEELIQTPPQGPERCCCKLALIHWKTDGGGASAGEVEDCRPLFPALTEMLQLHYAGGDGQEGKPGDTLPGELIVRVSRGEHPAENVPIVFEVKTEGLGGKVFSDENPAGGDKIVVYSDSDGLAACKWRLGSNRSRYHQNVISFIDDPNDARLHQQMNFNANLSIAEEVSYIPPEGCVNIDDGVETVAGALDALCSIDADGVSYTPPENCTNLEDTTTVAEALDALCDISGSEDDPAFHVVGIFWLIDEKEAVHDEAITIKQLVGGLRIVCDGEPEPSTIKQASVFITLELPSPSLPGVQISYILEGVVEAIGKEIFWKPSAQAEQFLTKNIGGVVDAEGVFLARLFLKGSKIWLLENPKIHLDGDVINLPETAHNLLLPSGDGEQGGAFEMWFNLRIREIPTEDGIHVVGVLHPKVIIGFDTTSVDDAKIVIEDQQAVEHRLDAMDLGYHHLQAIEDAGISGYTVSGTLFNQEKARLSMLESGITLGSGFEVIVLVQEEYENLAQIVIREWKRTFEEFGFEFSLNMQDSENISNALHDALEEGAPPGIVICDQTVLDALRRAMEGAEPTGIIQRPFFRRV